MIKVGITGQSGFMGTHLFNFLGLKPDEIQRIPFEDTYFENKEKLKNFVTKCDVIIHLAAMNRHSDPQVIYDTNIRLVSQLIDVLEEVDHKPHILFSSSTQEERDNPYGKSKKEGRALLEKWALRNNARFSGLIIPNVFGPFGNPYYNSVIATFCHQIAHNEELKIEIDASVKLIYINDLIDVFCQVIQGKVNETALYVDHTAERKVSDILKRLNKFKHLYLEQNIIPDLLDHFDVSLFNTFRCYLDHSHYPVQLKLHADNRGHLVEIIKSNTGGQIFYSQTKPGITRGNHFHRRKIERFCVVKGEASIRLRKIGINDTIEYKVTGDKPATIDMPIYYTHNITNSGKNDLLTLFWTNEIFNPEDTDTFYEEV